MMIYLIIYIIGFIVSYLCLRSSEDFWTLRDRCFASFVSLFWFMGLFIFFISLFLSYIDWDKKVKW